MLKREYDYDREQFACLSAKIPVRVKVRKGMCWYPLTLGRTWYNSLNQYILTVSRSPMSSEEHAFDYGVQVRFFTAGPDGKSVFVGGVCTVSFVDGNDMAIVMPDEASVSALRTAVYRSPDSGLGVQLFFDETSYRLMFEALDNVFSARDNRLAELRDILLGPVQAAFRQSGGMKFPWLNASQQEAVNAILAARDVMVVHGPPGTGKTTTLVEAIFETLFRETQVMVCAQSNMAVDWICSRLQERGVEVLRIGNPSRIDEKMLSSTFERRFEQHPEYPLLWKIRKSIREMQSALRKGNAYGNSSSMRSKIDALKRKAVELEYIITEEVFSSAKVVASTLVGAASRILTGRRYSTLFIDEAAQALEAAAWIAIGKADRVIFAGDHCQLPPTVKCMEAMRGGLGVTLMETVVRRNPEAVRMLTVQYRMNKAIMHFSSEVFYDGRLEASQSVSDRSGLWELPLISWTDTSEMEFHEKLSDDGTGKLNKGEAQLVLQSLRNAVSSLGMDRVLSENIDFGVISPYKAQVYLLRQLIFKDVELRRMRHLITINTVDGFQGQERDVIFISMVRSNEDGTVGFLSELRRMNVAMTRARYSLCIVGDKDTLCRHPFYKVLWKYVCGINAE